MMSGRHVSPQPSKKPNIAAVAITIPKYRGSYYKFYDRPVDTITISRYPGNLNGTTDVARPKPTPVVFTKCPLSPPHAAIAPVREYVYDLASHIRSTAFDLGEEKKEGHRLVRELHQFFNGPMPASPALSISKMKAKAAAAMASHAPKSSPACAKITEFVPVDKVESALETMFESGSVSTPSAPVPQQFCKTVSVSDLVGESVEKILKSPSPMKTDESRSPAERKPLSNGVRTLAASDSDNTPQRSRKNSQPHSNGRLQPARPQLEIAVTPVATNCDSDRPIKVENSTDPPVVTKKAVNKEETYVEVESELAKMFAGIEDSQSTNAAADATESTIAICSLPSASVAPSTSTQPEAQPSTSKTRKRAPRKRTRKPKASGTSSSKFAKTKQQSSKKANASLDAASSKRVPVIHIEGPKENPISVQIINSHADRMEEEAPSESRTSVKRKAGSSHRPAKKFASDNVMKKYVMDDSDTTWVCIFCKRSPYTLTITGDTLGDLFGPYFVQHPDLELNADPQQQQKKRPVDSTCPGPSSAAADEKTLQVWVHEDCLFWAPGVHLIGSTLMGLDQSVRDSIKMKCTHCDEKGANIFCRERKCKSCMHYICAVSSGWKLDLDTFVSACNVHAGPE